MSHLKRVPAASRTRVGGILTQRLMTMAVCSNNRFSKSTAVNRRDAKCIQTNYNPKSKSRVLVSRPQRRSSRKREDPWQRERSVSTRVFCIGPERKHVFTLLRRCSRTGRVSNIQASTSVYRQSRNHVRTCGSQRAHSNHGEREQKTWECSAVNEGAILLATSQPVGCLRSHLICPRQQFDNGRAISESIYFPASRMRLRILLGVSTLQQFATELRKSLSRKTVINILGTIFVILDYAKRCGTTVSNVSFSDMELGGSAMEPQASFFTREQASQIIAGSEEPYKTMFAVAWATGLRAGELLALGTADLDFARRTIRSLKVLRRQHSHHSST